MTQLTLLLHVSGCLMNVATGSVINGVVTSFDKEFQHVMMMEVAVMALDGKKSSVANK